MGVTRNDWTFSVAGRATQKSRPYRLSHFSVTDRQRAVVNLSN